MLPQFPQFKKIELEDKIDMEKITTKFPPYSDFNFMSLWSWDIKQEMEISELNGNLVIKFTDYTTGQPFYSFLGKSKTTETAESLLVLSLEQNLKPELKLIGEDSIVDLSKDEFKATEDRDNFDYIYDLNEIASYQGGKFAKKRNMVNSFLKKFPNVQTKILDLKDKEIQILILDLDKSWAERKLEKDRDYKSENELLATERFFKGEFENVIGIGLFIQEELIGYSILEIYPNSIYASSHFCKAKTNFPGVYDYLIKENARVLLARGCTRLNYEQDLGLTGLRLSKSSLSSFFLKKYVIVKS